MRMPGLPLQSVPASASRRWLRVRASSSEKCSLRARGRGVRAEWQEWHKTLARLQRTTATRRGSGGSAGSASAGLRHAQAFLRHLAALVLDGGAVVLLRIERRDLGIVLPLALADLAGLWRHDQQFAGAAQERDLALPARVDAAGGGGEVDVGRELARVLDEQGLVGGDELVDERPVDDLEVGHHPAAVLEHPVGADTDELLLPRQVRIEGEAAAGDRTVVALAVPHALAGDRRAVGGQLGDDLAGRGVVRLELLPEVWA